MFVLYMLVGAIGFVVTASAGYAIGIRQFQRRLEHTLEAQNKKMAELAAASEVEPRNHSVLLDGISEAGKTTFITRLACPVADATVLDGIVATVRHYPTPEFPLCWERSPEQGHPPVLHALRFIDVAGEKPATFNNAVNELARSSADDRLLVLVVWNLDKDHLAKNRDAFNPWRLDATYCTDNARRLIKHVIVFFNKVDRFEQQGGTRQRLEEEKKYIADLFAKHLEGYSLSFYSGSAADGRGVLDVYGEILRVLGLGSHYQPLTGNALAGLAI